MAAADIDDSAAASTQNFSSRRDVPLFFSWGARAQYNPAGGCQHERDSPASLQLQQRIFGVEISTA